MASQGTSFGVSTLKEYQFREFLAQALLDEKKVEDIFWIFDSIRLPIGMSTRRTSSRTANKPSSDASATSVASSKVKRKSEGDENAASEVSAKKTKPEEAIKSDEAAAEKGDGIVSEGKALPKLKLKDESGREVDIAQLKKTVIFTYVGGTSLHHLYQLTLLSS